MSRFKFPIVVLALMAATATGTTLFPQAVTVSYTYGATTVQDADLPIGAGAELTCTGGGLGTSTGATANVCTILVNPVQTIDFEDQPDRLVITYAYQQADGFNATFGSAPNYFTFSALNFDVPILGVFVSSSIAGLDASRVSFTSNTVTVDMADLAEPVLVDGQYFRLEVFTTPEPSTWSLAGLGIFVLLYAHRARKRRPS